jgi:hypothetical protein
MTIKHESKVIDYEVLQKHREECLKLSKEMFKNFMSIFNDNSTNFVLCDLK